MEKEKTVKSSRTEGERGKKKDRRMASGIQKTSEGQGVRKWDSENKRGTGSRTLRQRERE